MKAWVSAFLGVFFLAIQSGEAQTNSTNSSTNSTITSRIPYFSVKMASGTYTVSIPAITSVSTQTYVVDGAMEVTELCIGDSSSALARFYFVEPYQAVKPPTETGQYTMERLKQVTGEAATRLGIDGGLTNVVVKNYPTTTHSKTIEYRLPSKEVVEQLRKSAEEAFLTGKSKKFEIK